MLSIDGKLDSIFLPAAYCDTSFLLDFMAYPIYDFYENTAVKESSEEVLLQNLVGSKKRIQNLKEVAARIQFDGYRTQLIYSPLVTLECIDKLVERSFKNVASKYLSMHSIQRSGKKDILNYIKTLYEILTHLEEMESLSFEEQNKLGLCYSIFETGYGLADKGMSIYGIDQVDIINFSLTGGTNLEKVALLSQLQVGMADILHLLVADHLGCELFFTFDSDFITNKNFINKLFNIQVIGTIQEMEKVL